MASPVQFPVKPFQPSLTASDLIIRPEEQTQFSALQDSLLAELAPQGAIETVTFHDLLHAAWSLHRLRRLEVECDPSNEKAYDRLPVTSRESNAPTTERSRNFAFCKRIVLCALGN